MKRRNVLSCAIAAICGLVWIKPAEAELASQVMKFKDGFVGFNLEFKNEVWPIIEDIMHDLQDKLKNQIISAYSVSYDYDARKILVRWTPLKGK